MRGWGRREGAVDGVERVRLGAREGGWGLREGAIRRGERAPLGAITGTGGGVKAGGAEEGMPGWPPRRTVARESATSR
jgi:hypothetical protein